MELENTPLYNSQFQEPRLENTPDFYRGMIQAIVGEQGFPRDPIAAEDEIFYRLGELADQNAISEREATECWHLYIRQVRPDVRVVHLGEVISERARFYE